MRWLVLERGAHVVHPDRQGYGAPVFVTTQAFRLIEACPDGRDEVGVVAGEPAVLRLVGGAGLARDVGAAHGQRAASGTPLDDVLQHAVEDVGGAWVDDALRDGRGLRLGSRGIDRGQQGVRRRTALGCGFGLFFALGNPGRIGDEQRLAIPALDTLDQVGLDLVATIGEDAPATRDFQGCQVGGTQGQGQVAWQVILVEAEAADVVQGVVDTDGLQDADRHQVARLVEGLSQADGAQEGVVVVLRAPGFFHARLLEDR